MLYFLPVLLRYNWHTAPYKFQIYSGNSLAAQRLGLWAFTAERQDSVSGQETKISQATQLGPIIPHKDVQDNNLTYCGSVTQSCLTLCNPMECSTPGFPVLHSLKVCSNSYLLSRWCHPTVSSSVVPLSSCLQSFLASGSFLVS